MTITKAQAKDLAIELFEDNATLRARCDELAAENEALRALLRPLAKAYNRQQTVTNPADVRPQIADYIDGSLFQICKAAVAALARVGEGE